MQQEIEVEMSEMEKANYPDILRSSGLGPCIAIGFYDPQTRSGYMTHEAHYQYADLDGQIQEIQGDYGDLSRLKVCAIGNSMEKDMDKEEREFAISSRPHVEQILRKYFDDSQIQFKWMPDDYNAELTLDTLTGEFDVDVFSQMEMMESLDDCLD